MNEAVASEARTVCTIDIGVPTYKRPAQLARLLESVSRIELVDGMSVGIIVVDNDRNRSAENVVAEYAAVSPFPTRYIVEETTGVVYVRNRLLASAGGHYLAMIDDDEYVSPSWLAEMVKTAERNKADAVIGYVEETFPAGTRSWVIDCQPSPVAADQESITFGSTNNVLLRMSSVRERGLRFDPSFNLSGGEDTDFFAKLLREGGAVFYSARARVIAPFEPERLRFSWYAMRNYRVGQTNAIVFGGPRKTFGQIVRRLARGVAGIALLGAGSCAFVVSRVEGARLFLTGVRCLGYASTILDTRAQEYGKIER